MDDDQQLVLIGMIIALVVVGWLASLAVRWLIRQGASKEKRRLDVFLLCFFLGFLGAHRFYVGKVTSGIVWLLTGGLCGIGTLVDFICIIVGSFADKDGRKIERWT